MLELGAWNRVLFNLRRLRSNRVGWQGWSVSRIKFCDTAVVENLRYFQLRTSAKKSVKSAPSAVKFLSSFDFPSAFGFRIRGFSGACPPSAVPEVCAIVGSPPCGQFGLVARAGQLRRTGMVELGAFNSARRSN